MLLIWISVWRFKSQRPDWAETVRRKRVWAKSCIKHKQRWITMWWCHQKHSSSWRPGHDWVCIVISPRPGPKLVLVGMSWTLTLPVTVCERSLTHTPVHSAYVGFGSVLVRSLLGLGQYAFTHTHRDIVHWSMIIIETNSTLPWESQTNSLFHCST